MRESDAVEYKERVVPGVLKTIVAFSNTRGGTLYLGVDDDGRAIGIPDAQEESLRLSNMLHDGVSADALMLTAISVEKLDGHDVIVVEVEEGTHKPYYLTSKGMTPYGVYVRSGAASVPVGEAAILRMLRSSSRVSFEEEPCFRDDLTFSQAEEAFARRGVAFGEAERQTLGLLTHDGGYTNLALWLSDQCPTFVKTAAFNDDERNAFTDREECSGSLFAQLEQAAAFVDRNTHYLTRIDGLERIDYQDYPNGATREAIVNAGVHRDFSFSGPTLVSVMPSGISVLSLGGLPEGLLYEDLETGVSQPRNARLANVFYRLRYIEAYGTGIRRMIDSYAGTGLSPSFTVSPNTFTAYLPNRNHRPAALHAHARQANGSTGPSENAALVNGTAEHLALVVPGLGDAGPAEWKVEAVLTSVPQTRKEIEGKTGLSQATVLRALKRLMDGGKVRTDGKGRSTVYRLAGSL